MYKSKFQMFSNRKIIFFETNARMKTKSLYICEQKGMVQKNRTELRHSTTNRQAPCISDLDANLAEELSRVQINAVIFLTSSFHWFSSYGRRQFVNPIKTLIFQYPILLTIP